MASELASQLSNRDWGSRGISDFTSTTHHSAPSTLDPSQTTLSTPLTVCIVGASRGIGAGIALSFAKAGATGLVLASRRVSGLEETATQCRSVNPKIQIEIVSCDITDAESVSNLALKTKAAFGGRLDVVVVNSGYSGPVVLSLAKTDPLTFQNASNVNYVGTFLCAKYLIPLLLDTTDGAKAFIAVSTIGALIVRGPIANAQYCVSKAAQLKLMEHVHEQYSHEGLAAISVHPGAVMTEMADESAPGAFKPFLVDSPELCGAFCVWLLKGIKTRHWLSGRFVSANWDMDELEKRKDEIVEKDLLKMKLVM